MGLGKDDMQMKGKIVGALILTMALFTGCGEASAAVVTEYNAGAGTSGRLKTYYEMSDGTWQCDEYTYDQRLELVGREPYAAKDSSFVVLTNTSDITFEDVFWSMISSQSSDWLDPNESVIVEMSVVEE